MNRREGRPVAFVPHFLPQAFLDYMLLPDQVVARLKVG
jgi:hypothetical protein